MWVRSPEYQHFVGFEGSLFLVMAGSQGQASSKAFLTELNCLCGRYLPWVFRDRSSGSLGEHLESYITRLSTHVDMVTLVADGCYR